MRSVFAMKVRAGIPDVIEAPLHAIEIIGIMGLAVHVQD